MLIFFTYFLLAASLLTTAPHVMANTEKYPAKGAVMIGTGPLPLIVHYLNGNGETVQLKLRNIQYKTPDLTKSKELAIIARTPCRAGEVIKINKSELPGETTGVDAAGIGRFIWQITGKYSSDGQRWQFNGIIIPKNDYYNFNKRDFGERAFFAEVSTRIGKEIPGNEFSIQIIGSLKVGIAGICNINAAGESIV